MDVVKISCRRFFGRAVRGLVALGDDMQAATMVECSVLIALITAAAMAVVLMVDSWVATELHQLFSAIAGIG